ncbi:hypothetical protein ACFLW6_04335 [Chloroflexota bacterium]
MKKILAIVLALTMVLVFAAPVSANSQTWNLRADGPDENIDVGSVQVVSHNGNVVITMALDVGDWEFVETHVHVANSKDGIPHNGNWNPKIGKFAYSSEHDPLTEQVVTVTYTIPNPSGDTLYIAAHAEVYSATEIDPDTLVAPREESAWVQGSQMNTGKSWAMYVTHNELL